VGRVRGSDRPSIGERSPDAVGQMTSIPSLHPVAPRLLSSVSGADPSFPMPPVFRDHPIPDSLRPSPLAARKAEQKSDATTTAGASERASEEALADAAATTTAGAASSVRPCPPRGNAIDCLSPPRPRPPPIGADWIGRRPCFEPRVRW
jgi:hypothetical protein